MSVASELGALATCWSCLLLLGLAALPLTRALLGRFYDGGYPFSKAVAIGAVAYVSWLASSLGLLPLTRGSSLAIAGVLAAAAWARPRARAATARLLRARARLLVLEELAFVALLAAWAYVRGTLPDIHGLEKFMDHGFAAAITRSGYMPPQDMWFAGESINYYYFGHYVLALLARLSGVRLAVAYNLMIATIVALSFTLTLSLAAELARAAGLAGRRRQWLAGVASAALLTFGGNLHTAVFAYAAPALARLTGRPLPPPYNYIEATRYVGYRPPAPDKLIHEFPFYSFVVSDLHAHVSNIPFVLLLLAVLTAAFLSRQEPARAAALLGVPVPLRFVVAVAGLLALFRMTNAWDLPVHLVLTVAVVLARSLGRGRPLRHALVDAGLTTALVLVLCWALSLPFNAHFRNHYTELGWARARTPLPQVLVLWGAPLLLLASYLALGVAAVARKARTRETVRHPLRALADLPPRDLLTLVLAACATGLVIAPEIVFVRDIYGPDYHRANTYFKLGYQAFLLFGLVSGVLGARVLASPRTAGRRGAIVRIAAIGSLALPLAYPWFAVRGYYGRSGGRFQGLDGLAFLDRDGSGTGSAVRWLDDNVAGTTVVLESNGDSFTDFGRVSMATGLPTVLGWYAHEGLWRGSMTLPAPRARDVGLVYGPGSRAESLDVLRRYRVGFVVVGDRERERYRDLDEPKLLSFGEVVFEAGRTRIIRVRP